MSAETPSAASRDRTTPRVDRQGIRLQESDTAVRVALGRYTVDIVTPTTGDILAVAGAGVGTQPALAEITPTAAALLIELGDRVDARTAWRTQAWPLVC